MPQNRLGISGLYFANGWRKVAAMTEILLFFIPFSIALVSPGPNYAVLLTAARRTNRTGCLAIAGGIGVGEAIWASLALFGVAAVARDYEIVKVLLALGGGAFLAYIGWGALESGVRLLVQRYRSEHGLPAHDDDLRPQIMGEPAHAPQNKRISAWFFQGLGLMMLNPKAGAFWLSLTSVLVRNDLGLGMRFVIMALAVALSLSWHASLAWIVSAPLARQWLLRFGPFLDMVLGLVLFGLSGLLIVSILG